jgi:hypothetical protein
MGIELDGLRGNRDEVMHKQLSQCGAGIASLLASTWTFFLLCSAIQLQTYKTAIEAILYCAFPSPCPLWRLLLSRSVVNGQLIPKTMSLYQKTGYGLMAVLISVTTV